MMRSALAWTLVPLAALVGCGAGRYRVEIALPDGTTADRVLVQVVTDCGELATVVASSSVIRGMSSMDLGSVPAGTYGVRTLALDATCSVVAEGCVLVQAGEAGGVVRVEADDVEARACASSEMCACTFDAGPAPDATSCVDCDGMGRCEDLTTNRDHCGMCGRRCSGGERCAAGVCER